jgi:uncharacterized phage protein (TIGR01671 family)
MGMREIKFRAWDKANKRFGYLDHPFDNNWYEQPTIYGTCFAVFTNSWKDKKADNFEIMQYTGLKDKNGKDIYEGDIVKLADTNPVLFKVEIVLARYGYKTVFKHLDDNTIAESYFLDKCEVIGNIYENPELLEDKPDEQP